MLNIKNEKASNNLLHKTLFSLLILAVLVFLFYSIGKTENKVATSSFVASSTHPAYFFEFETFTDAVERAKSSDKKYPKPILGGVVPHHLLPSIIIADFFSNLSKQEPDTIILISPNHYELGDRPILSSMGVWETPFGILEPNTEILNDLYNKNLIDFNEKVLDREHGIGGIVPFIKYYIPNAKIVPIILSGNLKMNQIENLVKEIAPRINKKTVIVGSVDFAHYQIKAKAEANDEITLKLMQARDYQKIIDLTSAYIDSPTSIVTLLMTMEKIGKNNFDLIYHTNAGEILRDSSHEVTSYFSFVF